MFKQVFDIKVRDNFDYSFLNLSNFFRCKTNSVENAIFFNFFQNFVFHAGEIEYFKNFAVYFINRQTIYVFTLLK